MLRAVTAAVVVIALAVAGCGSSGLNDEEAGYCGELDRDELIAEGAAMDIDLTPIFDRGQQIYDSLLEDEDAVTAFDGAVSYVESTEEYVEVCRALYSDR